MSNLSKYVIFKPVPGGYVYRVPNAWVFGSGVHLLVDDGQKAAIINAMDSVPLFPIIAASWVTLSFLFASAALWAAQSPSDGVRDVLIAISVVFSLYGALFISRCVLLSRLRPITAGLPTTEERITRADVRRTAPPVVLSSTRLRILKVCFILMPFILVSLLIFERLICIRKRTRPCCKPFTTRTPTWEAWSLSSPWELFYFLDCCSFAASGRGKNYLNGQRSPDCER